MIGLYIIPLPFEGVSSNLLFSFEKSTVLLDFSDYISESWWDNPRHGPETVLELYSEKCKSLNYYGRSIVIIDENHYAVFTLVDKLKIITMLQDFEEKYFFYKSFRTLRNGVIDTEEILCRIRFEID